MSNLCFDDEQLGGIIKPNDGYCHLDGQGKYTESESQDYPSISQINAKASFKQLQSALIKDQLLGRREKKRQRAIA
jgi:hypothetical protein